MVEFDKLMESIRSNCQEINEDILDDVYIAKDVDVTIHLPGELLADSTKATISYKLDIDNRIWGVNGLSVNFPRGTSFVITSQQNAIDYDIDISAEMLNDAEITWIDGRVIMPSDLIVELDADYNLVSVELSFYQIRN